MAFGKPLLRQNVFFFLLVVFLAACGTKKSEEKKSPYAAVETPAPEYNFKAGEIVPSVALRNYPSELFALYLPKKYSAGEKLPSIIFFDPHGDGTVPLKKYSALADAFNFILIGSNNSKNGLDFDETNRLANNLIAEVANRFSGEEKNISLAGFSGGAKVALYAAAQHPHINAVIYAGAGVPDKNFSVQPATLGIAGTLDMNYSEVIEMDNEFRETNISHNVVEWKGKHEWSDTATFKDVFYWSAFEAMKKNNFPKDELLIKKFIAENSKPFSNPLAEEMRLRKLISFTENLADVSYFKAKREKLISSSVYLKSAAQKKELLEMESRMKQFYVSALDEKDLSWWQNEIARMNKMKSATDGEMYQRLLGYISLACFSFSNSALNENNIPASQKILPIYAIADPTNADQKFLSAKLYCKMNNELEAISSLREALKLGFKDRKKLETENDFASLRNNPEFQKMLDELK